MPPSIHFGRRHRRTLATLALLGAVACSNGRASIAIDSPREGATVTTTATYEDGDLGVEVPIAFSVKGVTLKKPGTCAGLQSCGHVHIHVDGDACNDSEASGKLAFNEEVFESPASANLIYCKDVTIGVNGVQGLDGPHVVTLELVADDESPILDDAGKPVRASAHVTIAVTPPGGATSGSTTSSSVTSNTSSSGTSAGGSGGQGGA